jgi:hypothetical protein
VYGLLRQRSAAQEAHGDAQHPGRFRIVDHTDGHAITARDPP